MCNEKHISASILEEPRKTTNKNLRPQEWSQTLATVAVAVGPKSLTMAVELRPLVQHCLLLKVTPISKRNSTIFRRNGMYFLDKGHLISKGFCFILNSPKQRTKNSTLKVICSQCGILYVEKTKKVSPVFCVKNIFCRKNSVNPVSSRSGLPQYQLTFSS